MLHNNNDYGGKAKSITLAVLRSFAIFCGHCHVEANPLPHRVVRESFYIFFIAHGLFFEDSS